MIRPRSRSPLTLAAIGLCLCLGTAGAASVLADLGVTEQDAHNTVYNWFCGGSIYFPGNAKVFKGATAAVRAEMVTAVLTFGKTYLQSDGFATRYTAFRDANRPEAPEAGETDSGSNAMAREMEEGIKKIQEQMKTMSPDMQKQMQEVIEQMRAQQKAMTDDPEMRKMLDDGARKQREDREQRHEKAVREFEERYPADVHQMIAGRLREFLDLTADIDFGAELVTKGEMKRFADPNLEQKSREWKLCFRAGKPAVDAARAFAQAWLTDLEPH
jgi:hypothetical protein